ncbi:MAG: VCBS repeat-containing protein [Verrucomicrobia bacterium]|nr:VCBS repeat-containing protein [Verrucomicrobiota bacterium]
MNVNLLHRGARRLIRGLAGLLLLLALGFGLPGLHAAQPFAKPIKALGTTATVDAMDVDTDGTLYVAGHNRGSVEFSPTVLLTDNTSFENGFLARQDANGSWVWAKKANDDFFVGNISLAVTSVKVKSDAVYVTGTANYFEGAHRRGSFVSKFTKSGTQVWIRYFYAADVVVNSVDADQQGNVYVGGGFSTFITGVSRTPLVVREGSTQLAQVQSVMKASFALDPLVNDYDAFVMSLTPTGAYRWTARGGGTGSLLVKQGIEETKTVAVDALDRLYLVMNVGGPAGAGYRLLDGDNGLFSGPIATTCDPSGILCFGGTVATAGRIGSDGNWQLSNPLDTDLGAALKTTIGYRVDYPANDLLLSEGKVYVLGYYYSVGIQVGNPTSQREGFLIRLAADSLQPDGPAVYFKASTTADTIPRTIRGRANRIFVSGKMGSTLRIYTQGNNNNTDVGPVEKEITSIDANEFVAGFDRELFVQWARTTARANDEPVPNLRSTSVAYDDVNNLVYWSGSFGQGTRPEVQLFLGDEPNIGRLGPAKSASNTPATWGFLAAFQPDGQYREQVALAIRSQYGPITINDAVQPGLTYDGLFLRGAQLHVEVPALVSPSTDTRHRCTGFRINGTVGSGDAAEHTFTLEDDSELTFSWQTEHRLTVTSDHASAGVSDTAAAGSAEPAFGSHWIANGTLVTAFIDGYLLPVDTGLFGTRYVVTGFTATGPALPSRTFGSVEARQQIPQFLMTAPATIAYHWKRQHRVLVSTTSDNTYSLPRTEQVQPPGPVAAGSGEFWFDSGSRVRLTVPVSDSSLGKALKGWRNADPVPGLFPSIEFIAPDDATNDVQQLAAHLTLESIANRDYWVKTIAALDQPLRLTWDFGDLVYQVNVALGNPVPLGGLPVVPGKAPTAIRVVEAPPGTLSTDAQVWDDVADLSYPVRPGIYFLDWDNGTGGKTVTQVFTGFPGDPIPQSNPPANFPGSSHYGHISDTTPEVTPAVDLDPDPSDALFFQELKYQTGQSQVVNGEYTATGPGRAVLLFSASTDATRPAVGDLTVESLRVRVVETRDWQTALGLPTDPVPPSGLSGGTLKPFGGPVTASAVELADFNQDGRPDLFQRLTANANRVYLNTGEENPFAAAVPFDFGQGTRANITHATFGDVNADNRLDVVEAQTSGRCLLYLNQGETPLYGTVLEVGPSQGAQAVALADVNRDGRADLLVGRHLDNVVEIYLNQGTTTPFGTTPDVSFVPAGAGTGTSVSRLTVGDLNGDGWPDLVVGRQSGFGVTASVAVFLHTGQTALPYAAAAAQFGEPSLLPPALLLADLNGDGRLDLIRTTSQSAGIANGFRTQVTTHWHFNGGGTTPFGAPNGARTLLGYFSTLQLRSADLDADGDQDLVLAFSGDSTVGPKVWVNAAGPDLFPAAQDQNLPVSLAGPVALGSLGGSELPNLVGSGSQGPAQILLNAGDRRRYREAIIGTRVSSGYDQANRHTGYLIHPNANYNASLHDRAAVRGPIIPVNRLLREPSPQNQLIVVWYERRDGILWPTQPVQYDTFHWPAPPSGPNPPEGARKRIVIASRIGSEGLDAAGNAQLIFSPDRYERVEVYQQPDDRLPGYNPNEEHARILPSFLGNSGGTDAPAAFALRNDLNQSEALITALPNRFTAQDYTSDPYVLVQYFDRQDNESKMAVYEVLREDPATHDARLVSLPGSVGDSYVFNYRMFAGERIGAPYPLNLFLGLEPCLNTIPDLSDPRRIPNGTYFQDGTDTQRTWFVDHQGGPWAVSGDSFLRAHYFYQLAADFWYPPQPGPSVQTGSCLPFLPAFDLVAGDFGVFDTLDRVRATPASIRFNTEWPTNLAVLKVGETLTYAGGENKADVPNAPGLPGVLGWAAGEVVFDSQNPTMATSGANSHFDSFLVRLYAPLEERQVFLPASSLPTHLQAGSPDVVVDGDSWRFKNLPPSLQRRVIYRPLARFPGAPSPGMLVLRGFVNDRTLGASDLTAAPPPVYVVEPNVLTPAERDDLAELAPGNVTWQSTVAALFQLSRNPLALDQGGNGIDAAWRVGLEPEVVFNAQGQNPTANPTRAKPLTGLGPGLALVTNPQLLHPNSPLTAGYVTLVENNHPSLGAAPITLHLIRVDPDLKYRGAIKTIAPPNVFDEKLTLRHTADFAGNVEDLAFAWWYREEDGTVRTGDIPPGGSGTPLWNPLGSPLGEAALNQVDLEGNPTLLLADHLFFVRYRHLEHPNGWSDWAGAANSSVRDLDLDGRPDYRAQLASGWVKRVLDALNPYEARIREFGRQDSPATTASQIALLGGPYVGPVALNSDKNVVENVGLIELYETVLRRARAMSIDAAQPTFTPGVNAAILLASTRLANFYGLLGNEAWTDALDPTLGFGNDTLGHDSLSSTSFCFQNQLPTLLDEELALLRGTDQSLGRPVFNRLFWNFTKDEGEVAYALNYQITDVNHDGFVDESDALRLYPQGHGDAWGHYLSAMQKRYDLLRHPLFNWDARGEYYNLLDVVIDVDFLDERRFAQTAAARAQVGAEIVSQTYRARYTENPDGQWQGYTDTQPGRGWGVTEWARRAGQAAFFDWVTANALLPYADTNSNRTGLARLDRQRVTDLAEISRYLGAIQTTLDSANTGLNPLGLDPDVVPFDIDPTHIDVGSTAQIGQQAVQGLSHFEQIYERAFEALKNANNAFTFANDQKRRLREVNQSADQLRREAVAQDLEFRNRLIEIFGTPYSGTIGSGKPYPAGYNGPDLNLFMYVDANDITEQFAPQPAESYRAEFLGWHQSLTNELNGEYQEIVASHFLQDITYEGNTTVELLDGILELDLPATAADYTFAAPEDWGDRAAPGRLQTLVSELLQAQGELAIAVGDYDFLHKQIRDQVELLALRTGYNATNLMYADEHYKDLQTLHGFIGALNVTSAGLSFAANAAHDIAESMADGLPKVVGTANDPTFLARLAARTGGFSTQFALRLSAIATEQAAGILENRKELLDLSTGKKVDELSFNYEVVGMVKDIEELLVNEGVTRIKVMNLREQVRLLLDQYRATLQEGIRLVDERRNANTRLAAATQSNRYHDTLFRSARHESLQKYRSAFDLAQRYCYLATKAYDYETNFDPNDRASAQPVLGQILRERTLGDLADTKPLNRGGLAGIMARLHENFRAVEGRLGFNNFQFDTTSFSLRHELYRATTDQQWTTRLQQARVNNLWVLPEFRRYCRPFAARTQFAQPGLVFRFGSTVTAGRNFFGQPLSAGDSSYDPTMFATKIRSAGVHLAGYPVDKLARTPYVYLVPAGMDVMTIPDSPTLETRTWNIVDQAIPVPHPTGLADLGRPNWIAALDSLSSPLGAVRRFSSFRAGVTDDDPEYNATRFIGRSVWNTDWYLIIPGQTLHGSPNTGLTEFNLAVEDIVLTFETYGYSGN